MSENGSGPLSGIRVLEFSQIVAAPVCGMNLSDLGADVIKVEPPEGEMTRRSGSAIPDESKAFQSLNRGKRGLVVDLSRPEGRAIIHRLVPSMDVVTTNYRPGIADRMGIDYETLAAIRPDLIYWENTGFGQDGPEAFRAGTDIVAQAYSGLMMGEGKVRADGAPDFINPPLADYSSGFAGAMGICAALFHRERTGQGQHLNTSLLRTSLFLQSHAVMREPATDAILRDPMVAEIQAVRAERSGYDAIMETRGKYSALRASFLLYYGTYRTSDGAVVLGGLSVQNRTAMRKILGGEAEPSDEEGFDPLDPANQAEAEEWQRKYTALFLERTVAEWVAEFDAAGVPVAPLNVPEEMSDDPQANADGMIWELDHKVTGPQRVVGPSVNMSKSPTSTRRPSPALGEHTTEVLSEAGYSHEEITAAEQDGTIVRFAGT